MRGSLGRTVFRGVFAHYAMPILTYDGRPTQGSTTRFSKALRLIAVVALHVALIFGLTGLDPEVRRKLEPVLVSLITPPKLEAEPPPPVPAPPPRHPLAKTTPQPLPPRPVARPENAPAAITTDAPPESAAPAASPVQPGAVESPAGPTSVPAVEIKPAAAPVIPPRFDAAYLNNPPPRYPRVARLSGVQGKVLLRVYVSSQGIAEKVEIGTSSGSPPLDHAAREAVERWKFVPARQGNEPIAAWVLVPITFVLEG
jgi:protein TonB